MSSHSAQSPYHLLRDIASVNTGFPFRARIENDPEGDLRVIQGKDIRPDLSFDPDCLTRIKLPTRSRPGEKLLQLGDILFMSRSERPYSVLVRESLPPTIVQNSFYTIRVHRPDEVLPEYLAMLLNQSEMKARMNEIIRGATIPYIRVDELRLLKIPVPPLPLQKTLAHLGDTIRRERYLHRQLEAAHQDQLDGLISAISSGSIATS